MPARASVDLVEAVALLAGGSFRQAGANIFRSLGICHGATRSESLVFMYDTGRGRINVHCHAGCSFGRILEALGLHKSDLYDEPLARGGTLWRAPPVPKPAPPKPEPVVFDPAPPGWRPPVDTWTPCKHGKSAEYLYLDEAGRVCFGVTRCPQKCFHQWRPVEGRTHRRWSLTEKDEHGNVTATVRLVPYRLAEVLTAIEAGTPVWYAEGEKDVAALVDRGCTATTTAMGGKSWRGDYVPFFAGARLTIVADRDPTGRQHAEQLVPALMPVVASLEVVVAAHGKDPHDHFAGGGTTDTFLAVWSPKPEEPSR